MDVLEPLLSGTAGGQEVERLPFVDAPVDHRIGRFVLRAVEAAAPGEPAGLAATGAVAHRGRRRRAWRPRSPRACGRTGTPSSACAPARDASRAGRSAGRRGRARGGGRRRGVGRRRGPPRHRAPRRREGARAPRRARGRRRARRRGRRGRRRHGPVPARPGAARRPRARRRGRRRGRGRRDRAWAGPSALDGDVPATASRQALAAGFVKSLAHEWPSTSGPGSSTSRRGDATAHAAALVAELVAADGLVEVGLPRRRAPHDRAGAGDRPGAAGPTPGCSTPAPCCSSPAAPAASPPRRRSRSRGRAPDPTLVLVGRTPLTEEDPADARRSPTDGAQAGGARAAARARTPP